MVISIVDDDELVRMAMGRLMRAHGYLAETFESGATFLESETRLRTGCLIADVQMPGMTGPELYDQLVAQCLSVPTVLITAHPDPMIRARALRAGVLCYLTKPVNEAELFESIRSAVEKRTGD